MNANSRLGRTSLSAQVTLYSSGCCRFFCSRATEDLAWGRSCHLIRRKKPDTSGMEPKIVHTTRRTHLVTWVIAEGRNSQAVKARVTRSLVNKSFPPHMELLFCFHFYSSYTSGQDRIEPHTPGFKNMLQMSHVNTLGFLLIWRHLCNLCCDV